MLRHPQFVPVLGMNTGDNINVRASRLQAAEYAVPTQAQCQPPAAAWMTAEPRGTAPALACWYRHRSRHRDRDRHW